MLIRVKLFHISIEAPNFKKRQLWFLAKPQFIRHVSTDLDGALFNVNAAISNAQFQNDSGKSVRNIIDHTISNKVRLRGSYTPLHCGVPGGVSSETISHCFN